MPLVFRNTNIHMAIIVGVRTISFMPNFHTQWDGINFYFKSLERPGWEPLFPELGDQHLRPLCYHSYIMTPPYTGPCEEGIEAVCILVYHGLYSYNERALYKIFSCTRGMIQEIFATFLRKIWSTIPVQDPVELGWKPYVRTWLNRVPKEMGETGRKHLEQLFNHSVERGLRFLHQNAAHQMVPAPDMAIVMCLCNIMAAFFEFMAKHGGFGAAGE